MNKVKAPTLSSFFGKQRKYGGVLAKPIIWRDGDEGLRNALTTLVERLPALYAHYRIDPYEAGAESRLLLALAMAHVPGCRVVPSNELGGRSPTPVAELDPFVRDVERLTKKRHSVSRACELLSKRQPYLGLKAGTLRRRFYEATRGKNKAIRDAYRAFEAEH
jgi:hypothetical protein